MKNLKLSLFGILFLALGVTLFFSSCSKQDNSIQETVETVEMFGEKTDMTMPIGFERLSEEEQSNYFKSLTPELVGSLEKSFLIRSYLVHINKLNQVIGDMASGSIFAEVDLTKYLSENEITRIGSFVPNTMDHSSRCITIEYCAWNSWCTNRYTLFLKRCDGSWFAVCNDSCSLPWM